VPRNAKDLDLVLHIGLPKTASTYLQNVLTARRYDLIQHGLLYPTTGTYEEARVRTREGAQAGHFQLTFRDGRQALLAELLDEVPDGVSTVLLSAEDLTHPRLRAEHHIEHFGIFRSIKVVAVLRRQDSWIESMYKQAVDVWSNFETRSLDDYALGKARLMDYRRRLSPWRNLVGPENFHVLSYDDLPGGAAILREVLEIAGVPRERLGEYPGVEAPRYDSVRAIDTLGLRILNGYRLQTRDIRNKVAREIYDCAPAGEIDLMSPELRAGIQERYEPVNQRIEAEWFSAPVPGLRFGADLSREPAPTPSGDELVDYLNKVVALCDSARELELGATADTGPASRPGAAGARRGAAARGAAARGAAARGAAAQDVAAAEMTGAVE
jgi:hypothetical protein